MPRIMDHINTFGTTVVHGDAHGGQFLCLHNETEDGKRVGIIDFGWAHLGNPAIDVGALMIGHPDPVEFIRICNVAAAVRGLFLRSIGLFWETRAFEFLDQATFDYLAEHTKTDVIGSSLLSYSSESPARPSQ